MKNPTQKNAFTLIELLVVIAIIGLLAGLLFPAVTAALNTAKKTKAKTTCQNIETAIMIYFNEYNKLPIPDANSPDNMVDDSGTNEQYSKDILKVLMAIDSAPNDGHKLNHKRKIFLETEVATSDGTYLDPWGTQYQIIVDRNLDQKIDYLTKSGEHHRKRAVVVSAGKNKKFGGNAKSDDSKDNLANVDLPLIN